MVWRSKIREHAKVVGADNVPVGTVDGVEGDHIRLTRADSGETHHFFIPLSLVADVADDMVWLSVNADVALEHSEEESSSPAG
jgi:hypothetical protein